MNKTKITSKTTVGLSFICFVISAISASEVEVKKGEAQVSVPASLESALKGIATVEEKVFPTSYYRNGNLRLIFEKVELTTTPIGKTPQLKKFPRIRVYGNGKEIMDIQNPDLRPDEVKSPWPIYIEHRRARQDGKELIYYNIAIPEIRYYEYLEFLDGELQPLLEGKEFDDMKEAHWSLAIEQLSK